MNRRRLILSAAGVGIAASGLGATTVHAASTATDDELAYAHFGLATEFLLQDFYARAVAAKVVSAAALREVNRGRSIAREHAAALTDLLRGAGQPAAVQEDFEFAWPTGAFASQKSTAEAGLVVTEALLGVYLGAVIAIGIPSYRTLFGSMSANVAQQASALSGLAGTRVIGEAFPRALDIETASTAIESYLG